MFKKSKKFVLVPLLMLALISSAQAHTVRVELEGSLDGPAAYGLSKLESALKDRGIRTERGPLMLHGLLIGTPADNARIRDLVTSSRLVLPEAAESLAVKRIKEREGEFLAVVGRDGVGLMYALLELAEELDSLPTQADWF